MICSSVNRFFVPSYHGQTLHESGGALGAQVNTNENNRYCLTIHEAECPGYPCQLSSSTDQGAQYTSRDWLDFLEDHRLEVSMSRRGNCHDNAAAESFFSGMKLERIKKKIYASRDEAR